MSGRYTFSAGAMLPVLVTMTATHHSRTTFPNNFSNHSVISVFFFAKLFLLPLCYYFYQCNFPGWLHLSHHKSLLYYIVLSPIMVSFLLSWYLFFCEYNFFCHVSFLQSQPFVSISIIFPDPVRFLLSSILYHPPYSRQKKINAAHQSNTMIVTASIQNTVVPQTSITIILSFQSWRAKFDPEFEQRF